MQRIGNKDKSIVPQSLQQLVMPKCHDVAFVGHVRIHRTLKLMS